MLQNHHFPQWSPPNTFKIYEFTEPIVRNQYLIVVNETFVVLRVYLFHWCILLSFFPDNVLVMRVSYSERFHIEGFVSLKVDVSFSE